MTSKHFHDAGRPEREETELAGEGGAIGVGSLDFLSTRQCNAAYGYSLDKKMTAGDAAPYVSVICVLLAAYWHICSLFTKLTDRPLVAEKRRLSLCVGCGAQIHDQYILRVAPDLEWHAACLKCAECHQFLDETCTCFVRDGKTYCKRDYVR
ncbi:Insulin protein enhancer protein isl-1 [Homalodisca vitripennis]|nr:Insulin protein enhancer protein isl-1 [Homalodisca vitripennis]